MGKPLVPRVSARRDVDQVMDHYTDEAGLDVALKFSHAFDAAYNAIIEYPAIGSPLHGYDLKVKGLRSRAIKKFPYLVFYVEQETRIEVWRVLHTKRDIPAWLQDEKV